MRADFRRGSAVFLAAASLGLGSGCDGGEEPLRVGVLVDCSGLLESSELGELAGAELPFKQRDGAAGGRRIELVKGCTEIGGLTLTIARTRSLIEEEGAEVVVGPAGEPEGIVMRRLAPRYPEVTFILSASMAQEATLRDSQPNVFRFVADTAQSAAGLGTYAYRELGWRRAAVVFDYASGSWGATAGFVAEFCSLGGEVKAQGPLAPDAGNRALAAQLARESDGVFLTTGFWSPAEFLGGYSRAVRHLPERLVMNGYGLSLPHALTPQGVDLSGVVLGGDIPRAAEGPEWRRYVRAFANAYPELPPSTARDQIVMPYYVGAEGLARALERVHGDIGPGGGELRAALARGEFQGPMGPIRLDSHRQAVVSIHLRRLTIQGERVTTEPVRVVRGVTQAYDGIFTPDAPPPALFELRCKHREPPAWARG